MVMDIEKAGASSSVCSCCVSTSNSGLKKFTVDELAAELHISKKTLYQYFSGKDEMIRGCFEETLGSDRQSVLDAVGSDRSFLDKIHAIVHPSHRYRMPVRIMDEAKQFYPGEWAKIE
jgi:AcrR family transcriptional regulator